MGVAIALKAGSMTDRGKLKPSNCHSIRVRNKSAEKSVCWSAWMILPPLAYIKLANLATSLFGQGRKKGAWQWQAKQWQT